MRSIREGADQAATLRRITRPSPVKVVAVTGGKGGVGKTNISVNLAIAMAELGREGMLLDADLGLANVDVLLGLQPRYNLAQVLEGLCHLEDAIIAGPRGVQVVPAASGTQRMARLSAAEHAGLIHAFGELYHRIDVMLVDTAAGISDSVITFTMASQQVMVVVCDEPAAITDAYALIKVLSRDHGLRRFHIVANMVRSEGEGLALFEKLSRVAQRFLDVSLSFMGSVPYDDYLRRAVQVQRPVLDIYPASRSARAFKKLATRADRWAMPDGARGHVEFFVERLLGYPAAESDALQ